MEAILRPVYNAIVNGCSAVHVSHTYIYQSTSILQLRVQGKQWWHSGESTCLPPIWPKFKSPHQRHMRLEFVTSSLLCSKRFFSLYSGFPLLKKPTLLNSNLTRNRSFLHSCKQRHQLEARVDKIQWFVWNCQPKPHPHFFMFVYWSIIRERSSVDEETLCSCSLSLLFSLVICFISFNLHQTFNLQESAMIKSALQSDWF